MGEERHDAAASAAPATPAVVATRPLGGPMYRAIFEHCANGIAFHQIVLDDDGKPVDYVFLEANAAFERETGLSREAIIGRRVTEVLPGIEDDPADWIGVYGRVALTGEATRFEQYSAALGRWYDVTAFSPAPGCFAVIFSDVTGHKQLQAALRERERLSRVQSTQLGAVLNGTHAQLALLDRDMRFVMVNDAYERACGHGRAALIGRNHFELFPHAENERLFRQVAETGDPLFVQERPFEYADQPERGVTYWNWSLVPVHEPEVVHGVLLSLVDVTEQVRSRRAHEQLAKECMAAEQAARESEARLRESDQRKSEFLAVLSHELRNPLAPIRNSLYILDHAVPGGEEAAHARAVLGRQTDHLTRLVDDLLDLTRISRGKIELRPAREDLREIVRRAADDFRVVLHERGITFRSTVPDAPVWADVDATRVAQVLGNLIHNAAKFTRRGDEVTVALAATRGVAEIAVTDTGAGIDAEMLPHVFDAFVQGERTLARTEGGLGLGLSLAESITRLHGGTVQVASEGAGKGSEFVVRLPLAGGGAWAAPTPAAARPSRGRRRVLVVDDNRDAAETMAEIIELLGHAAEVAFDGPSALDRARANPPNLVLCDIGLPGMTGYEVATSLRASHPPELQLVALTGYAQPDDVKRAMEAGFDSHLSKPADVASIERLLG